jgi:thymidine kinase
MLTIYTGCMFASKTTSLLAECQIALEDNKSVLLVKPNIDKRYSEKDIKTHDGLSAKELGLVPYLVPTDWKIDKEFDSSSATSRIDLVCIDEVQFLENAKEIVLNILNRDIDVACAGLDLDSFGNNFGKMGDLLCLADVVHKCFADCSICSGPATRTFRKLTVKNTNTVAVGGSEMYEPRCFHHWNEGMKEKIEWLK